MWSSSFYKCTCMLGRPLKVLRNFQYFELRKHGLSIGVYQACYDYVAKTFSDNMSTTRLVMTMLPRRILTI